MLWEQSGRDFRGVSDARSWEELKPALVAAWACFAEILGSSVPADLRQEINLSFWSSSGRVVFGHASRDYPGVPWDQVPQAYIWTLTCLCPWIEEQWDALNGEALGTLGFTFARTCLECASHADVRRAFERRHPAKIIVRGQGITQSPAAFETELERLLDGILPDLAPQNKDRP
jgi:hypothetical protein